MSRTPTDKQRYNAFSRQQLDFPIFLESWFLDAVCEGGYWDYVFVEKAEEIVAVMPYFFKKKPFFSYIAMPHICKFMGPFVMEKYRESLAVAEIYAQLIVQLPKTDGFNQNFHYNITNWKPFQKHGFQQTTVYSYVLNGLDNLEETYKNIIGDYRNNKIKKAKTALRLKENVSLETFFKIQKMTFDRQNISLPFSFAFLQKLDEVLRKKKSRLILAAIDDNEIIHSVCYLIWDKKSVYYLMAGDDPDHRNSGAAIFLVWEAIQITSKRLGLNQFDFLGSMIEPIERVRRNFGATQLPYFSISKYNSILFELIKKIK